jgi:hypothetical protein
MSLLDKITGKKEIVHDIENNFRLNFGDQMIVGFDRSKSMEIKDCPGGLTRFVYVQNTMRDFIRQANEFDPDGVSFYFFNNDVSAHPDVATPEEIDRIIAGLQPDGGTATDKVIKAAYAEHKGKKSQLSAEDQKDYQTFFLLFTDGEPNDKGAVEREIINITKDVADPEEFRIAILTVGKIGDALGRWLKELDDNLTKKGAKSDIVSIHTFDHVTFQQAINDAISGESSTEN